MADFSLVRSYMISMIALLLFSAGVLAADAQAAYADEVEVPAFPIVQLPGCKVAQYQDSMQFPVGKFSCANIRHVYSQIRVQITHRCPTTRADLHAPCAALPLHHQGCWGMIAWCH